MRRCPECKRLSSEDDFCPHCGTALYGEDEDFAASSCSSYEKGHTHEKQSYTPPYTTNAYNRTSGSRSNASPKAQKTISCFIIAVVIISATMFVIPIMLDILTSIFETFADI